MTFGFPGRRLINAMSSNETLLACPSFSRYDARPRYLRRTPGRLKPADSSGFIDSSKIVEFLGIQMGGIYWDITFQVRGYFPGFTTRLSQCGMMELNELVF